MKITECLDLFQQDNAVRFDINNYTRQGDMKNHTNIDSLLKDAQDVITKYHNLVYSILENVDIEDLFRK